MRRTLTSRGVGLDGGVGGGFEQDARSNRQRAIGLPTKGRIQLAALNEIRAETPVPYAANLIFSHPEANRKGNGAPGKSVGCVLLLNALSALAERGDGASKGATHPTNKKAPEENFFRG